MPSPTIRARSTAALRIHSGAIVYRSIDTPTTLEVRARWDFSGNVRSLRFFFGHQRHSSASLHLGHHERVRLALAIAPELRAAVNEAYTLLDDAYPLPSEASPYLDRFDEVLQLLANIHEAQETAP